jgi:class 3 adenylate cyclase
MGVFTGDLQSTNAVKVALKINWAVQEIINPTIKKQYPSGGYVVTQKVGVDTSAIHVARTGVRGGNDLVWVGRAANYAAKLTEIKVDPQTWITADVYNKMSDDTKYGGNPKENMWKEFKWSQMNDQKYMPPHGDGTCS